MRSQNLQLAVQAEKNDLRTSFDQQLKLAPAEQRKLGILLYPLTIVSQETQGSYTLVAFTTSFAINDAWFRKGCSIRCKAGEQSFDGKMQEIDDHTGVFALYDEELPNLRDETVTLQFLPDDRTLQCMELGCRLLEENPQLQAFEQALSAAPEPADVAFPMLNAEQQHAAQAIVGTSPVVLIQGPPGTGKTQTLAAAIEYLVGQKKRVIVSAPSNTAVDHLCHQLLTRKIAIVRVGNEEKMSDTVQAFTIDGYLERGAEKKLLEQLRKSLRKADEAAGKFIRNYTKEAAEEKQAARRERTALRKDIRRIESDARSHLLQTIPVIAGTPVGLFNELPKEFLADCVVLDEAGQCPEPLAWLTASFGKRLIVCGDPQQLPPVVFSPKAQKLGLGRSLLETAIGAGNFILLEEQYRMAPEIVAGINPYFYANRLRTHFADRTGVLSFIDMAGYGDGEQQDETTGSTFHRDEAEVVRKLIEAESLSPSDTVVLSPYNAQLGVLKALLPGFRISTIDAIQGQEETNIVISLTRSNPDQEIGFLKDYRRTNVAISRAKMQCFLVGDSATLGGDAFYGELIGFVESSGGYRSAWELP
jgi:ATP-dependent RNA/DNA helicase IGHMBP2